MASTIHHFVSHDGTRLGYRKTGNGAPLIIVHGAGRISQNYLKLAGYLASFFTVYIYDRRGRGLSGAITPDHSIQKETEDLEALIKETGAKYVFGHSFGGLVALQTALKGEVERLAVYESPITSFPDNWVPEFEHLLSRNKKAKAMAVFLKAIPPPQIQHFPVWLLMLLIQILRLLEGSKPNEAKMFNLLATVPPDIKILKQLEPTVNEYQTLHTPVCLMAGGKSQPLFRQSTELLGTLLPHSQTIIFKDLDHYSPEEKFEHIGNTLRDFFS